MTAIMKIPGVNQKMQSERRLPSTTSEVTVNFNERAHRITSTKKREGSHYHGQKSNPVTHQKK